MDAAHEPDVVLHAIARTLREMGVAGDADRLQFRRLAGGRSQLTVRVVVTPPDPDGSSHEIVVKFAGPDGPLAPYDVAHEASMMSLAHEIGVPAPEVIGHRTLPGGNGGFVVMRFVEGEAPGLREITPWLDARGERVRKAMGRSMLNAIGCARSLPATTTRTTVDETYHDFLARTIQRLADAAAETSGFEAPASVHRASEWLHDRWSSVPQADLALVHGDFRVGNLIFDDHGEVRAVVDWERAMFGHPYHDVGYLCLPGMRLRGRICGVFSDDELEVAWKDVFGDDFDRPTCAYFRIMSMFTEFCTMLRAQLRGPTAGALRQGRSVPLIITIQRDLLESIVRWDNGQPAL